MTDKTTVSLGKALDIMHVDNLKGRLITARDKHKHIVLIADKIEKADTAGLQLIYSFIRSLAELDSDAGFSWQKPSTALLSSCNTLGMTKHLKLN